MIDICGKREGEVFFFSQELKVFDGSFFREYLFIFDLVFFVFLLVKFTLVVVIIWDTYF